jgi:ATP-dependent HslUV protease ATP-binding subunit HslU
MELTPRAIVAELDKYVVGQGGAKRAIAVALRNRSRRLRLSPELRREVLPKNILMVGPTGVGKTELCRRVAQLIDAPFIKVEATKFTEVGYVGRDAESIIHDLVESSVMQVHDDKLKELESRAEGLANDKIITYLYQQTVAPRKRAVARQQGTAAAARQGALGIEAPPQATRGRRVRRGMPTAGEMEELGRLVRDRQLEDQIIEIEVAPEDNWSYSDYQESAYSSGPNEPAEDRPPAPRPRRRRVSVKEARRILTREEAHKLMDFDQIVDLGLDRVEERGVVFIDELDKLITRGGDRGPDVSGEGVQRDLLPIVEGTTVMTRYGPLHTDHILFIAAGTFHNCRPSDLIPELQGRFPLQVHLESLGEDALYRILTEPENALPKQYQALLATEGVDLTFAEEGLRALARLAALLNARLEDVGARRLHSLMEQLLEELSFEAPDRKGEKVLADAAFVSDHLGRALRDKDLGKLLR